MSELSANRRDARAVAALVRLAREGDEGAWNGLVDEFASLVWSIARAHRLSAADAADVSQTCWLKLAEHLNRIRDPERVGAWLAATTRHECLRVLRRSQRELPLGDDLPEPPGPGPPSPVAGLIRDERAAALWDAFALLPERCQALLRVLMADHPPSYEDVGAALDMPVGSIGPTRARCLERLRRLAARGGISGPDDDSVEVHRMTPRRPRFQFDPDDDALLDELRAVAAEFDPAPEGVLRAARGSFTWRTIDAELAELAYDSALDTTRLAAVRSEETIRLLTFETPDITIELEVTEMNGRRRILGQLVPAASGLVELRHASGLLELEADARGRFTAEDVEPGPVSLRWRREEGGPAVMTDWVTI
jgi:RNA polymerase sigma factor (sigma-70 family)